MIEEFVPRSDCLAMTSIDSAVDLVLLGMKYKEEGECSQPGCDVTAQQYTTAPEERFEDSSGGRSVP